MVLVEEGEGQRDPRLALRRDQAAEGAVILRPALVLLLEAGELIGRDCGGALATDAVEPLPAQPQAHQAQELAAGLEVERVEVRQEIADHGLHEVRVVEVGGALESLRARPEEQPLKKARNSPWTRRSVRAASKAREARRRWDRRRGPPGRGPEQVEGLLGFGPARARTVSGPSSSEASGEGLVGVRRPPACGSRLARRGAGVRPVDRGVAGRVMTGAVKPCERRGWTLSRALSARGPRRDAHSGTFSPAGRAWPRGAAARSSLFPLSLRAPEADALPEHFRV